MNNYIIVKTKYYENLKSLNNDFIKIMTYSTFMKHIDFKNIIMKKYFLSSDVKCLYGKNIYTILHNFTLFFDKYDNNIKNLYDIVKKSNDPFYLVLFHQLLNGIHLFETVNNNKEMKEYVKKNNLTNKIKYKHFKNELIEIYNNYY
jgi:hypothetical protein